MKMRLSVLIMSCLIAISCGGSGGSGDSIIPAERPYAEVSGYAIDGPITEASVTVFSWKDGLKGAVLGTATTDQEGRFSLSIKAEPQPIILEVKDGTYIEEASGQQIILTDEHVMYVSMNHTGDDTEVMITPYTTIAHGLAEYYINKGFNIKDAIETAKSQITDFLAFDFNAEYPISITSDGNYSGNISNGHMYGFFCAAISSWTAEISAKNDKDIHDIFNSIYLTQLMYRDVKFDGVLNGYGFTVTGEEADLVAGVVPLDSKVWRQNIAKHMLIAAGSPYNHSGIKVSDIVNYANDFSQQVTEFFGNEEALPLDSEGPIISKTEPDGKHYRGQVKYGFTVEDFVGVQSVAASIDGNPLNATVPSGNVKENVVVNIDTAYFSDGDHTIKILSSDLLGNESYQELTIHINNTETYFNLTVRSLNLNSDMSIHKFENGTMGDVIGQGKTDDSGLATIQIFTEPSSVIVQLTGGSYKESGTNAQVQLAEGQKLTAVANLESQDIVINVTPLTTVAAAESSRRVGEYPPIEDAVIAGNEKVSKIYGVNILNEDIINISDAKNATGKASGAHRHSIILAGLSLWTYEAATQNSAYDQQHYNSMLLAEKMAADISNDGLLNGGQNFGSVAINEAVYQNGFGNSITQVIESNLNATTIKMKEFIGTGINPRDVPEEAQTLGVSFAQRAETINREFLSTEYTLTNSQEKPVYVKINILGQESYGHHVYFDATRKHLVRRDRQIQYRGRVGGDALNAANQVVKIFRDWHSISRYHVWENNRWNQVGLPPSESVTVDHNSDQLPASQHVAWHYFINESGGNVKNHLDNPVHRYFLRSARISQMPKYEMVYDYWLDEIAEPVPGYNYGAMGVEHKQELGSALQIYLVYNGPHQSDWSVVGDQLNHITRNLNVAVTPEIQRDYSETWTTVTAPYNEISADAEASYDCMTRTYIRNGEGGEPTSRMGYYIIMPGSSLIIYKYVRTPSITLYSGGEASYTFTTFDRRITWAIDKNISVLITSGDDIALISQMPLYEMAHSGSKTYTITR